MPRRLAVGLQPGAPPADLPVVYLELGPDTWGKGFTEADAHRNARRPKHYIRFAITDPWAYVDGMGSICYTPPARYWEVASRRPSTLGPRVTRRTGTATRT